MAAGEAAIASAIGDLMAGGDNWPIEFGPDEDYAGEVLYARGHAFLVTEDDYPVGVGDEEVFALVLAEAIALEERAQRKMSKAHRLISSVGLTTSVAATSVTTFQRTAISSGVKNEVWQRDKGVCQECGDNRDLEFDHIIPVSMGGSNTARNLQLLCEPCNRSKGGNL